MASNDTKKRRSSWCLEWDVKLCRELLLSRPYAHKSGSSESAKCWATVEENLSFLDGTEKKISEISNCVLDEISARSLETENF